MLSYEPLHILRPEAEDSPAAPEAHNWKTRRTPGSMIPDPAFGNPQQFGHLVERHQGSQGQHSGLNRRSVVDVLSFQ